MRSQKTFRRDLLFSTALPGGVNQKCAVEQHQAGRSSRDRRRPATARLTAVQFTSRPNFPAFTSASKSAAVAFAGGKVMRRTTSENDSPARRVAFKRS